MTIDSLTPADFPAFFQALWGYEPFPWQTRLLERVALDGWPHTLDLPTASGKTGVLDIAVFTLALDAEKPPSERRAPLRMVFVIDRRVVVDQAFERTTALIHKLSAPRDDVVGIVAKRLCSIHGRDDAPPLIAAVLRGGMPREADWVRAPDQPSILVSTVDQVGSRLLFRGYGVSDTMRPVHAGLLGEDVLYLLDEVHLSKPFEETLAAVHALASRSGRATGVPHRFGIVRMSATPGPTVHDVFALDADDWNHSTLSRRLRANKQAALRQVDTPKNEAKAREKITRACVDEVGRLLAGDSGVEVAAVIVNRVDTARQVAILAERERSTAGCQVCLMTGRMRPLDRQDLLRNVEPLVRTGRVRGTGRRVLVISTQAIEAGADFDFDALVTECASLDALRQRFGRLDREGTLGTSRAVVVAGSSQVAMGEESVPSDAVYDEALARTWSWLSEIAEPHDDGPSVDFGIEAFEDRLRSVPENLLDALLAPRPFAPILLPTYLDLWAQTAPPPSVEPDVSMFLHGPGRKAADVQIVWRADIQRDWIEKAARESEGSERPWLAALQEIVSVCPPSALEALSVPLTSASAWLSNVAARSTGDTGSANPALADVEGEAEEGGEEDARLAPVLIWRGDDSSVATKPGDLFPGATIVVPAVYGGIRSDNWDPEAVEPAVPDRGDEAQLLHRARAIIRWHAGSIGAWAGKLPPPQLVEKEFEENGAEVERAAFKAWCGNALDEHIPDWARTSIRILQRRNRLVRVQLPDSAGERTEVWRASVAQRRVPLSEVRRLRLAARGSDLVGEIIEAATEHDGSPFLGTPVALIAHLERVRDHATQFSRALGLTGALASDVALAAWVHDVGKIDPRFQRMLHGGDDVRMAVAKGPLAKSGIPRTDRVAWRRAHRLSGYPSKARHELLSVSLVQASQLLRDRASDWDLVLHLVASHHGHCRPFAPLAHDREPMPVRFDLDGIRFEGTTAHGLARLDSGASERFWRLVRRHGWWRLALLESIVRLADHRASKEEEEEEETRVDT